MFQKKTTKKQAKEAKQKQLFLIFIAVIFLVFDFFLLYKIFSFKKILFISPVSISSNFSGSNFEDKLKKAKIQYSNLRISNGTYSFDIKDEGHVIMYSNKDLDKQISSLQLILKRIKIEGKRFKSLDFRYDNPVIVLY